MFYRFNAHKQARSADGQGQDKHAAMDKAAGRIASGILKVQRRWAQLMSKWAGMLPGKWLRIFTLVSFCVASYFFLSLILPGMGLPATVFQQRLHSLGLVEEPQTDGQGMVDSLGKLAPKGDAGSIKH